MVRVEKHFIRAEVSPLEKIIYTVLFETGSYYVVQVDLELWQSSYLNLRVQA